MPTENELKYLLKLDCESLFEFHANEIKIIRQGYLVFDQGHSLRIRESTLTRTRWGTPLSSGFSMTYKKKVGDRLVEVETSIDERDFNDLWSVALNKLVKIRYVVIDYEASEEAECWEVDAFKDENDKTYIIIAEHEMPEWLKEPEHIPDLIQENLLYAVPSEDHRFASGKIANVKYSQNLYEEYKI